MPLTENSEPAPLSPGTRIAGSFRDPSGFVFEREGVLYRQVNSSYRENYGRLMQSGLYDKLAGEGLLVAHQEAELHHAAAPEAYKVLQPNRVPFISYPYEWCFSQLKDAALATLRIQKLALAHGMVLKDSSAYNIQFAGGRPVLIDTLSFESYQEGEPWVGYRQYCQHFLGPLALIAYRDFRLVSLLQHHIDGIPVDLASTLLPARTRLKWPLLIHIHLHARSQIKHAGAKVVRSENKVTRLGFQGLMDSLESGTEALQWRPRGDWADYYSETNYSEPAFERKKELVSEFLQQSGAAGSVGSGRQRRSFQPAGRGTGKTHFVHGHGSGLGGSQLCRVPKSGPDPSDAAAHRFGQSQPEFGLGQPGAGFSHRERAH